MSSLKYLSLWFFPLLLMLFSSCEEDTVELENTFYLEDGRGTSQDAGALELRFSGFNDGGNIERIEVGLSGVRGVQRVRGREIRYENISPGRYSYSIDVFEWRQSVGVSSGIGIGFGSGGVSTTGGIGVHEAPRHEHVFLDGTADIRAGQVLVIEVKI